MIEIIADNQIFRVLNYDGEGWVYEDGVIQWGELGIKLLTNSYECTGIVETLKKFEPKVPTLFVGEFCTWAVVAENSNAIMTPNLHIRFGCKLEPGEYYVRDI